MSCNPFIPLFFPFVPKVVSAMYVICVMFIIVKKMFVKSEKCVLCNLKIAFF